MSKAFWGTRIDVLDGDSIYVGESAAEVGTVFVSTDSPFAYMTLEQAKNLVSGLNRAIARVEVRKAGRL